MTVFADIAGHITTALGAIPDFPAVRTDIDIAMPQSRASDATVRIGRSVGRSPICSHTDWDTAIEVRVAARPQGATSASTRCDQLLGQVVGCLNESNGTLMVNLLTSAAYAINPRGDRLIDRDVDQLDTSVASALFVVVVQHRTIGDSLNPFI